MTEAKHTTPTPWQIDPDAIGQDIIYGANHAIVAQTIGENFPADAALIVSAVNAYPLLNEAAEVLRHSPTLSAYHGHIGFEVERFVADYQAWGAKARALLSKMEGRP